MRPKKLQKEPPKILQDEASKIKQKLQDLKLQIQQKKKQQHEKNQKEKNKKTNLNGFFKAKPNTTCPQSKKTVEIVDGKLEEAFKQLKMQKYETVLLNKGVQKYQDLLALTEPKIDELQQIPVGYRIKMRIYIKENSSQSTFQNKQLAKDKQIEQIIKNRSLVNKYIPIKGRQLDQDHEEMQPEQIQIDEQEQETMINFLKLSFQPRQGIIKLNKTPSKGKGVHWSQQVDIEEMRRSKQVKQYPKQLSPAGFIKLQMAKQQNTTKYCWSCFKLVHNKQLMSDQKYFCSKQCLFKYQDQQISLEKQEIAKIQIKLPKQEDLEIIDLTL